MPTFDNGSNVYVADGIKFSAKRPEELKATEYTLVTIVRDVSGSVTGYKKHLEDATRLAIKDCKYSDRSDNLLVRVIDFNEKIDEIHGFTDMKGLNVDSLYDVRCGGSTALYDAILNAVKATHDYAKTLYDQDFGVNAFIVVETDGEENMSYNSLQNVIDAINNMIQSESLESVLMILVGCNATSSLNKYLKNLSGELNFNAYVPIFEVKASTVAKLSGWLSKSISSQSKALGTGGPSQVLTF